MKNVLKVTAVAMLMGMAGNGWSQDIHISQFFDNAIMRNPALTGIFSGEYKVGLNYRNQWASIANPYSTTVLDAETRVLINRTTGDYLSFGVGAYYDKAGSINFTSTEIYPTVAINKAINDAHNSYLSVGLSGGYIYRSVDMASMTFSSQYQFLGGFSAANPSGENTPYNNLHVWDVGAGVSFNSSIDRENRANYYVGASVYHINRPKEVFNTGYTDVKLPMKWQLNGGINLVFSERWSFAAHVNWSQQKPSQETVYGGLITYHTFSSYQPSPFAFSFGSFVRANDAVIPTVKFDFGTVSLGASYDVTNSGLASGTATSATEISLMVRGKYIHRADPRDGIMCPRFENEIYYPFNN